MQRKQHEWFVREVGKLPIASSSGDALGFLKNWILEHIMGTDQQYVAWRAAGSEKPQVSH